MKIALPVTLALGGLSLAIAILATFMFYVYWMSQPVTPHIDQPRNFVEIVNSVEDLTRLKQICNSLAESQDSHNNYLNSQSALVKRALTFTGLLSIGWGLISGIAFLYVHFLLRRAARNGSFEKPV